MLRKRMVFKGWVQGVGFRYRAVHAAQMYGATGWVINDPSGSVTMEIQGTQDQIDQVIMAIENGHFITIDSMEVTELPVKEDERVFGALLL